MRSIWDTLFYKFILFQGVSGTFCKSEETYRCLNRSVYILYSKQIGFCVHEGALDYDFLMVNLHLLSRLKICIKKKKKCTFRLNFVEKQHKMYISPFSSNTTTSQSPQILPKLNKINIYFKRVIKSNVKRFLLQLLLY